jgi:hypothetical protein
MKILLVSFAEMAPVPGDAHQAQWTSSRALGTLGTLGPHRQISPDFLNFQTPSGHDVVLWTIPSKPMFQSMLPTYLQQAAGAIIIATPRCMPEVTDFITNQGLGQREYMTFLWLMTRSSGPPVPECPDTTMRIAQYAGFKLQVHSAEVERVDAFKTTTAQIPQNANPGFHPTTSTVLALPSTGDAAVQASILAAIDKIAEGWQAY